jgi:hypothetical protein
LKVEEDVKEDCAIRYELEFNGEAKIRKIRELPELHAEKFGKMETVDSNKPKTLLIFA